MRRPWKERVLCVGRRRFFQGLSGRLHCQKKNPIRKHDDIGILFRLLSMITLAIPLKLNKKNCEDIG